MDFSKLKRYTKASLLNCSWEVEGNSILSEEKSSLSQQEKEKLKFLLSIESPGNSTRKKLWMISSGAKKEMKENKDYYSRLLTLSATYKSLNEHQIKMDLNRTFPEEPFFKCEENLTKLQNILTCYSLRNAPIGYCQGFNFIAGRLLQVFDNEEEVFWVFTQVLEEMMPFNYYSELSGMITDCLILVNLLQKYLPDLFHCLKSKELDSNLDNFIHKWFVSLFVQNFKTDFSLIVWDFFFLEGSIVLFKAALAVFKLLKDDLMNNAEFEEIYNVLNTGPSNITDYSNLIYYLSLRRFEFDYTFLNMHRVNMSLPVIENIQNENRTKLKLKQKNKINSNKINSPSYDKYDKYDKYHKYDNCDLNSPFCRVDLENDFQHLIISHLNFKVKTFPPKIMEDYFTKERKSLLLRNFYSLESFYQNLENDTEGDILIHRRTHLCKETQTLVERKDSVESSADGSNWGDTATSSVDILKIYDNIKQDENFCKANKTLSVNFKPKPFLDGEFN